MRFKKADLPGLLIAVLGPVALFFIVIESYQLWDHHGSPILGIISVHLAIGGGLIGAFWRFVRARDVVVGLALALAFAIVAVLILQSTGDGDSLIANILKGVAVLLFLGLNLVIVQQLLWNGLNPILQRRDDRRAAALEEQA